MSRSHDAQALQFAADWALQCVRLQLPRMVARDADLKETLGKLQELYKSKISERLVKQRIFQWMLARRRVMDSFFPCRSSGLPREAVEHIVAFVGDARAMNPMTAEMAGTLSSTATSWIKFEENLYVDRVLADVSTWWLEEGADLVARSLDKSHGKRSCIFTIPRHTFGWGISRTTFKFRPAQFIFFKDKEYFNEETHILRRIAGLFAASPSCYKVKCFLHHKDSSGLNAFSITKHKKMQEWEKSGWKHNLLGTPNCAGADLLDCESIEWTLTW
ncbi:unnamed protein product [Polarella glacialis]|uniref:Uncharacterized protein n=1 Tax=Polarella glacialis TaxID=89957 RepID=A0A813KSX0_POLGL|nr:unnamed protein product [Polarella glacialis]CAE8711638.1 unnamed protein product [Polarella glacialis]